MTQQYLYVYIDNLSKQLFVIAPSEYEARILLKNKLLDDFNNQCVLKRYSQGDVVVVENGLGTCSTCENGMSGHCSCSQNMTTYKA
jgi:hypothetical protein